ncbi:hypothetical protein ACMU_14635 [Actibacterium mucosum KCTC 23349]|uniref:HTH gntR-type domain-containing protein n=2 Tax=Actibacterium TaxID=1433986 RepID=A0A037ZFT6_9RHOB|nr:hypothetical protein ACMU_14635 [Actibacterium mucosum KCTC 23349]
MIDMDALSDLSGFQGTLAQRVYAVLLRAIMTMAAPPGAILRKPELSERLGVSRSPLTEAFARLSADGLVDIVPQSGSRVTYLSLDEIYEASFLRTALEVAAVRHVAAHRDAHQMEALERNLRLLTFQAGEGDLQAFFEVDEAFHALLFQFTGYKRAGTLVRTVSLQLTRARHLILPQEGRVESTLAEHAAIMSAIRAGNAAAAQAAMEAHLDLVAERLAPLAEERPELFRA